MAIERLKEIGCYRGTRYESGLPCRGQRTHTDRRTAAKRKQLELALKNVLHHSKCIDNDGAGEEYDVEKGWQEASKWTL